MNFTGFIQKTIRCLEAVEGVLSEDRPAPAAGEPSELSRAVHEMERAHSSRPPLDAAILATARETPVCAVRPPPTITQAQIDAAAQAIRDTPRCRPNEDALKRAERIHNKLTRMINDEGIDEALGMVDYFIAERMINFMVTLAQPASPLFKDKRAEDVLNRVDDDDVTDDDDVVESELEEEAGEPECPPADPDVQITTDELCGIFGCGAPAIYGWINNGMPHIRISPRKVRFELSAVKTWIRDQHTNGRRFRKCVIEAL